MSKTFTIFISLVIFIVFGFLVLLPRIQDLQKLQAEILIKQTELSQKEAYFKDLESLFQKIESYKEAMAKVEAALPEGTHLGALFNFLQQKCAERGLVFKETGPSAIDFFENNQEIKETEVTFEIAGKVDSLLTFLGDLEKSARMISVSSLSLKTPKEKEVFDFLIKIKVYSR